MLVDFVVQSASMAGVNDKLKVFCRIRPLEKSEHSCVNITSRTTISVALSNFKQLHCSFHKVFNENSSQKTVFQHAALPLIMDIFKNKDSVLILCGNTGSGKTYTLTGNLKRDGIIPLSLDVIFSTIVDLQTPKFLFRPDKMNGFDIQNEDDASRDRYNEHCAYLKTARNPLQKIRKEANVKINEENLDFQCTPIDDIKYNAYAVFISFIVIYKNGVYDLLDVQDIAKLKHPQTKMVREDCYHNMYVHGVVEEEVKTNSEAYEIYLEGLKRRRIVASLLNTTSTRLHSVFTIRLVQAPLDETGNAPVTNKNALKISQLCFVHLARPEKVKSAANTARRLMESGHINNSLTTLRMCLEVIRENQILRNKKMVPYRDSKLTYLMKNFFEEGNKIYMLICLNPFPGDFDGIGNVTKFAQVKEVSLFEQKYPAKSDFKVENKKMKIKPLEALNSDERRIVTPSKSAKFEKYEQLYSLNSKFPRLEMGSSTDDLIKNLVPFLESRHNFLEELKLDKKRKEESFYAHLKELENRNVMLKHEKLRLQTTLDCINSKENILEAKLNKTRNKEKELIGRFDNANSEFEELEKELRELDLKRSQVETETKILQKTLSVKLVAEKDKSTELQLQKLQAQETNLMKSKKKIGKPLEKIKRVILDEATSSSASDSSASDKIPELNIESDLALTDEAYGYIDNPIVKIQKPT